MSPYALLLALALGQSPPPGQTSPFTVQVGLFSFAADGSESGAALIGSFGPFEGHVSTGSGCGVAAGDTPPSSARNAWRITGDVIENTSDGVVVQLDWQRWKDSGQVKAGPLSSQRLTLRIGTPVVLDSMWADATEGCNVVRINLEARLRPRAAGNGITGFGQASGGGRSVGPGGGSAFATSGASGSGGGARIVTKATSGSDASYDIDVWLVHQPPTGAERVLQVQPRFKGDWFNLTFLPLRIDTPRGVVDVTVGLSLALTTGADGHRELSVSTTRKATFVQAGGNSSSDVRRPEESGGSSETKLPMPRPEEILSFEMPPLQNPSDGSSLADRISVRLRIKPVQ